MNEHNNETLHRQQAYDNLQSHIAKQRRADRIERRIAAGLAMAGLVLLFIVCRHYYMQGEYDYLQTLKSGVTAPQPDIVIYKESIQ